VFSLNVIITEAHFCQPARYCLGIEMYDWRKAHKGHIEYNMWVPQHNVLLLIIVVLQEIFIERFRRRNSNFVLCYCNVFCDRYECNERDIVINHVTGDAITAVAPAAVGRTPSTAAAATDYNAQTDTHTSLELHRVVAT